MNWDVIRTVMCMVGAVVLGVSLCGRAYHPFMGWWLRRQQRRRDHG